MQATEEQIVVNRQFAIERYILSTMPVLYLPLYRLDGDSFISADGHGHVCTVTEALWTPNGRWFDGTNDEVDLGASSSLRPTTSVSLLLWVLVAADAGAAEYPRIIGNLTDEGGADLRGYGIYQDESGRAIQYELRTVDDALKQAVIATPSLNEWNFYGLTYTSGTITPYYNGAAGITSSETGNINYATSPVNLALGQVFAADFFQGQIGEALIYNRVLSPVEIQHNYLATKWRYQ